MVGDLGTNYMNWTGTALNIKGTIGGEISEISVGSIQISDRLSIDEDGIIANDGTETTFSLDSNTGNAYFKGHIDAGSGTRWMNHKFYFIICWNYYFNRRWFNKLKW